MKINVLADIYTNYFADGEKYYYDNIRSVIPEEQGIVDEVVSDMLNNGSKLLFPKDMIFPCNTPKPLETDRKCILNTEQKVFSFDCGE
ncbi:hypothetical protein ACIWO4_06700 [Avibacterium paragallinarum]|uniref:hypothetical protein n=1 Tax=Avibacterium paragallinarum TaxID=728 RepID=UPI0039875EFC